MGFSSPFLWGTFKVHWLPSNPSSLRASWPWFFPSDWKKILWESYPAKWCPGSKARWWFQLFFIFTPIWGRFPIWLIFFQRGCNHQLEGLELKVSMQYQNLSVVDLWWLSLRIVMSYGRRLHQLFIAPAFFHLHQTLLTDSTRDLFHSRFIHEWCFFIDDLFHEWFLHVWFFREWSISFKTS